MEDNVNIYCARAETITKLHRGVLALSHEKNPRIFVYENRRILTQKLARQQLCKRCSGSTIDVFDNPKLARCRSPVFNGFSILGY